MYSDSRKAARVISRNNALAFSRGGASARTRASVPVHVRQLRKAANENGSDGVIGFVPNDAPSRAHVE
jgi:DNA-binding response OmpR family regulator